MNEAKIHKDAVPLFDVRPIAHGDAIIGGYKLEYNERLAGVLNKGNQTGGVPFPQKDGRRQPDAHIPNRGRFKN